MQVHYTHDQVWVTHINKIFNVHYTQLTLQYKYVVRVCKMQNKEK